MSSRFFRGSDSESEDSTTSCSSSEEETIQQQQQVPKSSAAAKGRKYVDSDEESEDEVKRVVKSSKDKRFEEIGTSIKAVANAIKINDWTVIQNEFEKLNKSLAKIVSQGIPVPSIYIRVVIDIEDAVKSKTPAEVKKSMNASNSKAFNAMKQKIKKNNKVYEDLIAQARLNPEEKKSHDVEDKEKENEDINVESQVDGKKNQKITKKTSSSTSIKSKSKTATKSKWFAAESDSSSGSEKSDSGSDSESDADASSPPAAVVKEEPSINKWLKKPKRGDVSDSDSSSDDDMDDMSSDGEGESDSDDESGKEGGPSRWFKKESKATSAKAIKRETKISKMASQKKMVSSEAEDDDDFKVVGKGGKIAMSEKEKAAAAVSAILADVSPETLLKKLREVLEARGKKGTDREQQITILQSLYSVAVSPFQRIKVQLALISAYFDFSSSMTSFLPIIHWQSAVTGINGILDILDKNPKIVLREDFDDADMDGLDSEATKEDPTHIRGSLVSLVDRLDDEFTKSLQNIDPHTTEYIDRLKDETVLYTLIVRAQAYFERTDYKESLGNTILRRVEHIYFKPDTVHKKIESATALKSPNLQSLLNEDSSELIHKLCVYLYHNATDRIRTRAILCHVFHHALHDRFHKARDMMLMSHVQETISQADIPTQVLFNRAMVQLGLCAFRLGLIKECQLALQDILQSSHVKELLAQGFHTQRNVFLSPEQEKFERSRQLPFHMHINLELLESTYLVSSMLIEIPNMVAHPHDDGRKRMISKIFRRMLDFSERSVFNGPPENTRDHIMAAAKCLYVGQWEKTTEYIMTIKIWDLMPEVAKIKEVLALKIREQALRSYINLSRAHYSNISLSYFAESFSLPLSRVHSIIASMIINEEIHASLDGPLKLLIFHQSSGTLNRVQWLATQFAEKTVGLVESNERNLDSKVVYEGPERPGGRNPRSNYNKDYNNNNNKEYGKKPYHRRQ